MTQFTEDDFNRWRFHRNAVHINGGREFFAWGHRCLDQPRLLVMDKGMKKTRTMVRSYIVDGRKPCATLPEALELLAAPPVLTAEDIATLRDVPTEWFRPEQRSPLLALAEMGMVEWGRNAEDKVTCRRTEAGTRAITAAASSPAP